MDDRLRRCPRPSVLDTSDATGYATIKDLPPGDYIVETWHEKYGTKTIDVTLRVGKTTDAEVTYSKADKKKKN